jgi:hypothetical protein
MKAFACLLLACWCCVAAAQLRDIPADAKRGKLRHVFDMDVEIDGTPQRLSRGARIRDADNRVVVPTSVAPDSAVKYRLDAKGMVREVWILSPREAEQADKQDKQP